MLRVPLLAGTFALSLLTAAATASAQGTTPSAPTAATTQETLTSSTAAPNANDPPPLVTNTSNTSNTSNNRTPSMPVEHRIAVQFLVGVGAATLTVPTMMLLSSALGSLSNDLVAAALPGVLIFGLIPPFAVATAVHLLGDRITGTRTRFGAAIGVTLPVHFGVMALGALSGAYTFNLRSLALLTITEALVLPAVTVLMTWLTRPSSSQDSTSRTARRREEPTGLPTMASRAGLFAPLRMLDGARDQVTLPLLGTNF